PALPIAGKLATAKIPVPVSLSASGPCDRIVTKPPSPLPSVPELICAPPANDMAPPAISRISPAPPREFEPGEPVPALITVLESDRVILPAAVNSISPPLPDPTVLLRIFAPPSSTISPPALNRTSPAAPVDPSAADALIELLAPDRVISPSALTSMSPAVPEPAVLLLICAPPRSVRLPAANVIPLAPCEFGPAAAAISAP